jgi:hypothetical protein
MRKPAHLPICCAVLVALATGRPALAGEELKPGDTLDRTTWSRAESLLPPEILKHYREGEYVNRIAEWPATQYNWPPTTAPTR